MLIDDMVGAAFFPINLHKHIRVGTETLITGAKGCAIPLLHLGEMGVQLVIKILTASVSQSHSHAKIHDNFHTAFPAIV